MTIHQATMTMGILHRQDARRMLQRLGLRFEEDRGWIDSQFIIYGTYDQLVGLKMAWDAHMRRYSR